MKMLELRSLSEAASELSQHSDVGVVVIPNHSICKEQRHLIHKLKSHAGISFNDVLEYIPPGSVGQRNKTREEVCPKIHDTSKPYIVVDDVIESMKTIKGAVAMFEAQGVSTEKIWICVYVMAYGDSLLNELLDTFFRFRNVLNKEVD